MSTTAIYYEKTFNNKKVHVIKADLDCVNVEKISGSVLDSNKFGVNGTFFNPSTGNLLGIAVANGSPVKTGGDQTGQACNVLTKRGTFFHYKPSYKFSFLEAAVVKDYTDTGAPTNQIKWAIGGYSLFLGKSYANEAQYLADINGTGSSSECANAQANTENAFRLNPASYAQRTAIGWDGSKIVLAVFEWEKAYGVRQFMKNEGCSLAIMLDGGGSSQMRFLVASPSGNFVGKFDPSKENRKVYNMVTVNPTTWSYQP